MDSVPAGLDFDRFADWLAAQRNDMQPAAESIAPPITTAMIALRRNPAVRFATMSGSGATCVGLVRDMGAARQVARAIQVGEMAWWVAPAQLLS
jgi:4-diphosphocytidyl-2-C-methyl-D-erythritol kinase